MSHLNKIKPNLLIGICLVTQIILTILGNILDWKKLFSSIIILVAGCLVAAIGYSIHLISHRYHQKAHQTVQAIDKVITEGIFAQIRHPMYLGMILFFWGGYLAWSYLVSLPVPIITTILIIALAKSEEKLLIEKLGNEYLDYQARVKWMFIPHLF